jgi:trehalose synthase
MDNVVENALLVNAMQRAAFVIVQNSLREGFGLTATEAMYKKIPFVGTEQACGLRTQASGCFKRVTLV